MSENINNTAPKDSRRDFLKTSAMLAVATTIPGATALEAKTPKISGGSESKFPSVDAPGSNDGGYNILFILTDQEHYMGKSWPIPLPSRERLRKDGIFFENHQIAACMCSPSRAVIYTGLHMPNNGIFDNAGVPYMKSLSPKLPTVGKVLRKIGYYPAYKGKWHLNSTMMNENNSSHINALFESTMDKDYGFYDYTGVGDFIDEALGGYQYDGITTAQAIEWLKAKGRPMTDKKQPWYLAVNLVNPHDVMWVNTDEPNGPKIQAKDATLPIAFPPHNKNYEQAWNSVPLQSTWKQSLSSPDRVLANTIFHEANGILTGIVPNEESRIRARQNYYFNAIQESDRQIGLILEQLDSLDLTKNTIIIFTADHGELLSSHGGLTGKGTTIYKQQNHVPLIIAHPEYKGGASCFETTSHIDILPTIVSLTKKNITPAKQDLSLMKGKDLTGLLKNPQNKDFSQSRGGVLFCYSDLSLHDPKFTKDLYTVVKNKSVGKLAHYKKLETFPIDWSLRVAIRCVTDEKYKFARYFSFKNFNTPVTFEQLIANNDIELYDLQNDPEEVNNLAYDAHKNKEVIMMMNAKLNTLIKNEIGVDNGSFLPLQNWINWNNTKYTDITV